MPEEFAGLAEIAETLGVSTRTAQRYIDRVDFPEPVGRLAGGRIWRRDDVKAWAKGHLPLKPGPAPRA